MYIRTFMHKMNTQLFSKLILLTYTCPKEDFKLKSKEMTAKTNKIQITAFQAH